MANIREIQGRMKSIQDTMKITNAMYMISSSKMKRAKKVLSDTEPYFYGMQSAISRILRHVPDIEHPYFESEHPGPSHEKRIGTIVVTADKGLAGAYNHNILKLAEEQAKLPGSHTFYVLGELGRQNFRKKKPENVEVDLTFRYTVQRPTMHRARLISERLLHLFQEGTLDEVHIIYTVMVNAMTAEPQVLQLLPLKKASFGPAIAIPYGVHQEEIMLNPSADAVLSAIIPNYVTGVIYGCLVESYASEQNARMTAMESSTRSAKEMLRDLSVEFNRARQAAITQEITEVISGAKAQKSKS